MDRRHRIRRGKDRAMAVVTCGCTLLVLAPLILILVFLAATGISALNWEFFTRLPGAAGEPGGGMANAIAGTLWLISLAGGVGVPIRGVRGALPAQYAVPRLCQLDQLSGGVV